MKQKVLFVAHMLRGHVLVFHLPYMKWFQEQGYEVHLCSCNDTEKPVTEVPYCPRVPFFHRCAASQLAAVLPGGTVSGPVHRPADYHQPGGRGPSPALPGPAGGPHQWDRRGSEPL